MGKEISTICGQGHESNGNGGAGSELHAERAEICNCSPHNIFGPLCKLLTNYKQKVSFSKHK